MVVSIFSRALKLLSGSETYLTPRMQSSYNYFPGKIIVWEEAHRTQTMRLLYFKHLLNHSLYPRITIFESSLINSVFTRIIYVYIYSYKNQKTNKNYKLQ